MIACGRSLRRYLIEELGIPDAPNSPKRIFRLAHENDLFVAPLEQWLNYADRRVDTAHDYSGEKAQACLGDHGRLHRRRHRPLPDDEWEDMGIDRAIDITGEQRKTILALLERHLPNTAAWVYGSRAKWTSRPQSDLDMVVFVTPEQNRRVSELREAFEESNLPFRVDLFVWDDVPEQFRKRIKRDHVVFSDNANGDPVGRNWLYRPQFPSHWKRQPLHSMAQWVNGLAFRNLQFSSTGKPVIKITEIKGGISGQTKFTTQIFDESVRVLSGDLLFSWSGQPETSIDAFWWRGPEGWLNQHIFSRYAYQWGRCHLLLLSLAIPEAQFRCYRT